MGTVLLDGPAGHDADLAQLHRVIDLRPGQLFVAILFQGATGHGQTSSVQNYPNRWIELRKACFRKSIPKKKWETRASRALCRVPEANRGAARVSTRERP